MTQISILPPNGLTTTANPNSGNTVQFSLFSDSWVQLQAYIAAGLDMPLTTGDFEKKYGSFGPSQTIQDCIAAMRSVGEASREFGDPRSLRAQLISNPNILGTPTPPNEIYTHIVWLGQRVHQTAATLASGYEGVLDEFTDDMKPEEKVENLKAFMLSQTLGPIPLSRKMSDEVGALIRKLGIFEEKMNEYNAKMQKFTGSSSQMITDVNQTIGVLSQRIRELEKSRDEAYKAWKDFTIAAAVSSVGAALIGGLLIPFTGGVSALIGSAAAAALGLGLGLKAEEHRAEYNQFCKEVENETLERKKKVLLSGDLSGFDLQMKRVGPAMKAFLENLQIIQAVWTQMNSDMVALHHNINEDNIENTPFLIKMQAKQAIDAWKAIDDSAKQFTVQSLVDYTSIAFGDRMPENIARAA